MKSLIIRFLVVGLIALVVKKATAAEPKPAAQATTNSISQAQLDARLVAVNRKERAVTVEVKGELHTVKLSATAKIMKGGKEVPFDHLAPGQLVTLLLIELSNGEAHLVMVTISPSTKPAQPAGKTVPTLPAPAPFPNPPNPANVGVPPVSPHR